MARHSVEIMDASWGAIADAARLRAAIAETDALMLAAEREKAFDGDASATREVLTVIGGLILFVLAVVGIAALSGAWLVSAL